MISEKTPYFPDENVSAEEKCTPEWLRKFSQAAYVFYMGLPKGAVGFVSADKYKEIKMYANGRQTINKYKAYTSLDEDPETNAKVTDWSIRHAIPRYRRIALGLMEKNRDRFEVRIDPIDALAVSETEKKLQDIKARLYVKEQLMAQGMPQMANAAPLQKNSPEEPDDLDGLQMMELGIRHHTAMECEQLTELVFNANDVNSIMKVVDEDKFDYGFCAMKDSTVGDNILIERCAPEQMVVSYCYDPQFKDWRYIGRLRRVNTPQLIAMSNGQLTKEQMKDLWEGKKLLTNQWMPVPFPSTYTWNDIYTNWDWTVFDIEIRTTNMLEMEESVDKRGNIQYGKATKNPEKRAYKESKGSKFYSKPYEQVYRCKWVCGTDIIFDYGYLNNQKIDPVLKGNVLGSYHIWASSLDDMRAYSRTEALIPYADDIQIASANIQHTLARAVPKGYQIDMAALESVAFQHNGKNFTKSDLLDMLLRDGIGLYNSAGIAGHEEGFKSFIQNIDGGVGNEIQEYWNLITQATEGIKAVLGLNDITDASTPDQKTLVPVANYAAMATNNALSDLFYCDKYLMRNLTKSVVIRAQDIIRNGNASFFLDGLGTGTVALLKNINDIQKYIYTVSIEEMPTDEEAQLFAQEVQIALETGQITLADRVRIKTIKNQKQREEYLVYVVNKNAEKKQQEALALQQQNGQVQIQSAQAAEQAKQQTLQMDYQLQMQLAKLNHELKMEELQMQGSLNLEGKRIDATGRVEASYVQASGRDAANIRDNQTALIKEGMPEHTGDINIPANLESRVEPATSDKKPNLDFSFLNE